MSFDFKTEQNELWGRFETDLKEVNAKYEIDNDTYKDDLGSKNTKARKYREGLCKALGGAYKPDETPGSQDPQKIGTCASPGNSKKWQKGKSRTLDCVDAAATAAAAILDYKNAKKAPSDPPFTKVTPEIFALAAEATEKITKGQVHSEAQQRRPVGTRGVICI